MTEEDARAWVAAGWGESAAVKLEHFAALVAEENQRQNLVSAGSLASMWVRHIVDSAQLVQLAENRSGIWLDVGTGGGFPGMVAAILRSDHTLLVEPRRRRADFLAEAAAALALSNVSVHASSVERVGTPAAIISARAVASPIKLFELTAGVASSDTLFLLPSGRDAQHAVAEAERAWRGVFHVKQSITSSDSWIIVAQGVERR